MNSNIHNKKTSTTAIASSLGMQSYMPLRLPLCYLFQSCLVLCLGLLWFTESIAYYDPEEPLCLEEGGFHHCVDAKRGWVLTDRNDPTTYHERCWNSEAKWKEALEKEGLPHAQEVATYRDFFRDCADEVLPKGRYGYLESCSDKVTEEESAWKYYGNYLNRGIQSRQYKTFDYERKAFYWDLDEGETSACGDGSFKRHGSLYRKLEFSCQDGYRLHRSRPICYRALELEDEEPLSCRAYSPNPVSMQTGEKRLFEEDYAGTAFGGLRFSRSYRANGNVGMLGKEAESSLGENWQHNYSARVYPSKSKKGMHLRQGEGGGLMSFNQSGKVPYETGGRSNQQLKKRGAGWRYERGDGYYEDYDSSGRLLRRHYKDARGTETLAYSGDRLASVTDSSGRKLVLSYDGKGRLIKLTHPGGEVRYTHGERNLTMVENADGSRRQYHYELVNLPEKLTGYSDRGAGETKWVRRGRYKYKDFSGHGGVQVLSTEHEGAEDQLTFGYHHYSNGRRSYSWFQVNEDWQEVFSFTDSTVYPQRLHNQGGRSPRTYIYSDSGQLSSMKITGKGYAIQRGNYEYDEATGLEVVREEGDRDPYRWISTSWSDRWVLPVEVTRGERKKDSEEVTELLRENYRYDGSGRLLEYSEQDVATGQKWLLRYGYDRGGRLLWEDGYREDVTDISRYEYDARGHRTKYTNALGQVTRYVGHDVHGNVTGERDANGLLTSYSYDKRSRLVRMRVGDWETRYERDQDGRVTRLSLSDGSVLAYRYNTGGKLVELKDSAGNRISYKRDAFDNVLEERWYDSEGEERRRFDRGYEYDSWGITWERDGADRWVQEETWGRGWWLQDGWFEEEDEQELANVNWRNREQRVWNYLNQLIWMRDVHGEDTELEYDVLNNVNLVKDSIEKKTRYGSNAFGDRLWEESVATGRTSYEVDSAGNRTRMRSADGSITSYRYDALGRLLVKDDAGEETDVSYTWDTCHIGSLCGVTDGSGKWVYNYTVHGLESRRSYQPSGVNWQIETSRDWHQGRLIGETLPSGRILKYRYHKNGQLRKIVSQRGEYRKILLGHISWLPFGDVLGYRHNNGVSEAWKYDKSYRLLEQKSELHHFEYEWTQYGGMLSRQQYAYTLADGVHRGGGRYEYYGGNRGYLKYENLQRGEDYFARGYGYYANSNRRYYYFTPLSRERDRSEWGFYDWDWEYNESSYNDRVQLVGVGRNEVGYQYDAVGRRSALLAYTEEGSEYTKYKYEYGSDRRLHRIVEPVQTETEGEADAAPAADRVVAEYEYDHRGLRVKKTIGKQVRYFNYDDQGRLWSEHRPDGTVVREYVWLGYRPVHMVSYSEEGRVRGRYAIHVDHLGTPRMLTDRESRIVWLWESDAFGNGAANEDVDGDGRTVKFPLRFPGQYYDKETGLHYNWHRYYDPTIGRYITSDPIGLDGGMNTYAYVDSNPLMYIDPQGLTSHGNHKLDQSEVDRIKKRLKDPKLDKRTRKELKRKLRTHEKAIGERRSRQSKDRKSKGKFLRKCLNFIAPGLAELFYPSPQRACDIHRYEPEFCDSL